MQHGSALVSDGTKGQLRGPFAVWLLSLVKFGIYGLVWYFKINRELRDFHPSIQVKPGLALLALFVPIAGWVSIYNTGKRIGQAQQLAGLGKRRAPAVSASSPHGSSRFTLFTSRVS